MSKKRVKIIVDGRVQGVGFRYFVSRSANVYGVNGFVRNLPNGSVEIDAESESKTLDLFIAECRKGPLHATVQMFEIIDLPVFRYQYFKIK
jgi:acylphosphatase